MTASYGEDMTQGDGEPRVGRLWQVRDAEAELPFIRRVLGELRYLIKQTTEMHIHIGLEEKIAQRIAGLKARGIEVKDLATGLVDFYAVRDGQVIYLCWKEGERGIRWWHPVTEGFNSRQKLTPAERAGSLRKTVDQRPSMPLPGYH